MPLKESQYPVDEQGRPDLGFYTDSLEYYMRMYEHHIGALQGKKGSGYEIELSYSRRVHGTWGLIAKGAAASPYALNLLGHPVPEAREDGAGILAALGGDAAVVDKLIETLNSETDITARDSIVLALGRLKNKRAIPSLAAIIRDASADGDTKWLAVGSLGLIVRKRFLEQENPIEVAVAWLDSHPDVVG